MSKFQALSGAPLTGGRHRRTRRRGSRSRSRRGTRKTRRGSRRR